MKLLIENFRKFLAEGDDDIDVSDLERNLTPAQKKNFQKLQISGPAAGALQAANPPEAATGTTAPAPAADPAPAAAPAPAGQSTGTQDNNSSGGGTGNFCDDPKNNNKPVPGMKGFVCKGDVAVNVGYYNLNKDYKFVFLKPNQEKGGFDPQPGFLWQDPTDGEDLNVRVDRGNKGAAKDRCKKFRTKCWKYRNKVPGLKDIVGSKPPIRRSRSGIRKNLKYSKTVKLIQQGLEDLGYGLGPKGIDGKLGNKTLMAIAKLKRNIAKQSGAKAAARVTKNLNNLLNFIKTRSPTDLEKLKVPTAKQAADSMAQSAPTQTPDDNDIFNWDPYEDQERHKKQDEDEKYDN
jgi:hypothetical protein